MRTFDGSAPLSHTDMPGLYQAADAASLQRQRAYLRAIRFRLMLVVVAAMCAAFTLRVGDSATDLMALGTALAFVGALVLELAVMRSRPDQDWYESRALAESVKTLTWRYAVGADPFPLSREDADDEFLRRIRAMQRDLPTAALKPTTAPSITEGMRSLRVAALDERRHAYLLGRVTDQQNWYATKAEFHRRRAGLYRTTMQALEVVGIAGALAKALGWVGFDLAGIIAAAVSAIGAWTATRQHSMTATAYVMASHELGVIRDLLDRELDEEQWSSIVVDAESAISREHTMWRAHHK